jgi:hypothetical protein
VQFPAGLSQADQVPLCASVFYKTKNDSSYSTGLSYSSNKVTNVNKLKKMPGILVTIGWEVWALCSEMKSSLVCGNLLFLVLV